MHIEMSTTQQKRVDKISRLKKYFQADSPEIYEWVPEDESIDFTHMSDEALAEYLKRA